MRYRAKRQAIVGDHYIINCRDHISSGGVAFGFQSALLQPFIQLIIAAIKSGNDMLSGNGNGRIDSNSHVNENSPTARLAA